MGRPSTKIWERAKPGCTTWLGSRDMDGYAIIQVAGRQFKLGRLILAEKLGRDLLPGMLACHACDNPPCIDPSHLYEGTNQRNQLDSVERGAHLKLLRHRCEHCGTELTVSIRKTGDKA